jgi:hypothetical protein
VSTHGYHEGLPGFSPEQILHTGCAECEWRGQNVSEAIVRLDGRNFARAWKRAADWNTAAGAPAICEAEAPLLRVLWSLQLQFERLGIPVGQLPSGDLLGLLGGAL